MLLLGWAVSSEFNLAVQQHRRSFATYTFPPRANLNYISSSRVRARELALPAAVFRMPILLGVHL